mmetsp:Transcript_36466/g.94753  ORF Transcript_36466/g.94753 Transcript_36466/m.94753 type:complete len:387 (-) Transcript_36466:400-1560(-)
MPRPTLKDKSEPRGVVRQAFQEAQASLVVHKRLARTLWQSFLESRQSVEDDVMSCIKLILPVFKREPAVERLVQFVVRLCTVFNQEQDALGEEPMEWFTSSLTVFLLRCSCADDKAVRFRSCQLVAGIMKTFTEDTELDDSLWDKLQEMMMDRLDDVIPIVRAQAVNAISRLQNPGDADDEVTIKLLSLLYTDGSKEVRKAVLTVIAITPSSLKILLLRTRDERDDVRRHAVTVLAWKVNPRQLSIEERVQLVSRGLRDRSAQVRKATGVMIVDKWYHERCQSDIDLFLKLFDIETFEKETETAVKFLLEAKAELRQLPTSPFSPSDFSCSQLFILKQVILCAKEREEDIDACLPPIESIRQAMAEAVTSADMTRASLLLSFLSFF